MIRRLTATAFVTGTAVIIAYLMLFTAYAPDAYVFVRYAAMDNVARTINFKSLLDNNFLFDALSLLGDWLGFSTGFEYLLGITMLTLGVFIMKYFILLRRGNLFDVMLLCAASFFVLDLNQLRFNVALCLLIVGMRIKSRWRYACYAGSGMSHVIPLPFYVTKRAHYLPAIVLLPAVLFFLKDNSRLYDYVTANERGAFKSLLFIVPFIWCYVDRRFIKMQNEEVMELGLAFAFFGVLALSVSTIISARLFEMAFVLAAWSNVNRPLGNASRIVLTVFACGALLSRSLSGITAGPGDYTEQFKLTPSELVNMLFPR